MTVTLITVLCGAIIGLAVFLLIRSLRKMSRGQCCEGCSGCPQADNCSSANPAENDNRMP